MKSHRRIILLLRLLLGVAIVGLWEGLVRLLPGTFHPALFGQPSQIVAAFADYAVSGFLLQDTLSTIGASVLGLVIGMALALTVGVWLGTMPTALAVTEPYLVGLNSLPRPALAPIFLLWFGLGLWSKVFVSVSLVFFVVFFNVLGGLRNIDRTLIDAVRVTGASPWQIFRHVTLPSVYSWLFAGFRTSVSFSLIGAVVGEFVGASRGLGYRMVIATGILDTHLAFAILLWMGALGSAAVILGMLVERRVLHWQDDQTHRMVVQSQSISRERA